MSNTHNTNKNTFKCTNPCSRIKRALGWLPSRALSPVLCLASLSHNFIQWLITFIPLWLPQRRTSPLFLKTGTGTFLHSSDVLSRCCHLVQTHQESAFPLLTATVTSLHYNIGPQRIFVPNVSVDHSTETKEDRRRTEQVKQIRCQSSHLLK